MKQDRPNFFDSRTMLAIALVTITFIGWQFYMQKKYPDAFSKKAPAVTAPANTDKPDAKESVPVGEVESVAPEAPVSTSRAESYVPYESETISFAISSKGMGLKDVRINEYKDRDGKTIVLGQVEGVSLPLETRLLGSSEALDFEITKVNENLYVGRAKKGDLEITKTLEVQPQTYALNFKVSVVGNDTRFVGVTTQLAEEVVESEGGSFFLPQFSRQEFFVESAESEDRVIFDEEDISQNWAKVKVASIGSQYFTQAVVDKSQVMPDAKARVDHKGKVADLLLQYPVLNRTGEFDLEFTAFLGPKSLHVLKKADQNLADVVDFGFFNTIGRYILAMLRWFHDLVGNWGVAVILMTLVVRLLVLPFNLYSYKSMKAMQVIQPKIQAMREKYKDDSQRQQQEMMTLMRENKVNPLGGCLPVFLQFPIFIALYQVLGNSIELYQAPFGLWIHDLSLKDPYYILPVLLGVTMFVQQKITPNTMDPAQAKLLLMMPVLFSFLMLTLPSGLTLYMLVGAVFGVAQQLYFLRDTKPLQAKA